MNLREVLDFKYQIYEAESMPAYLATLMPAELQDLPDVSEKQPDSQRFLSPEGKYKESAHRTVPITGHIQRPSLKEAPDYTNGNINNSNMHSRKLVRNQSYYSASMRGTSRKNDNMSQKSSGSRRDRLISKGLDAWNGIFNDYYQNLTKYIKQFKEHFNIMRLHLQNSQNQFAAIFTEDDEFNQPLQVFVESFKRFVADNPEQIKAQYTKNKLKAKLDSIHDRMWAQIKLCQKKAEEMKSSMLTRNLVNADVQFLCKSGLNMVASELNKLFNIM